MMLFRPLRRGSAVLLTCFVAFAGVATFAAAQETPDELREQRREVQEDAANTAAEVDALSDDIDGLTADLDALRASVDAQQAALDAARRRVADAEAAEAAAEQRIVDLEAEIVETRAFLQQAAVDAFTGFQGPDSDLAILTGNPWQVARTESLVEFGTGNTTEFIDDLRALGSELESERVAAAENTATLDEQRAITAERAAELEIAVAREEEVLAAVEDRLDARLYEMQALQDLDADLAAEIKAAEQRIADAIAARNRANRRVSIPDNAPVELTTVRGFVVNVALAENLEGFLAALEARGYTLGGGGYRSSDGQIAVRRSNCGTSEYAIWEMPAYQCRPPTARPGRSQHERGLALDFTYNGSIIRSRSTAVWQEMKELGETYGLFNLPSEPWHWSTTGG
jgi:peptidoglycan hydrolase CwlO-like protein